MKRMMLLVGGGLLAALLTTVILSPGSSGRAQAAVAPAGPQLVVGGVAQVDATHISFTVSTAGSGFSAYSGWNLEIVWNPDVFQFSSADLTGAQIDSSNGVCPGAASDATSNPTIAPPSPFLTTPGSFVNMGCVALTNTFTSAGLLATVDLTVVAPGCSAIHLVTYGPPDGGDSSSGSFTVDAITQTPQANTYQDTTANELGASGCTAGATPTPTGVATATPVTPSPTPVPGTPTSVPTATASPFGGLRTVTPTVTPTETATAGAAPTQAPTQPVGQVQQPSGPGGAPAGAGTGPQVTLPNTGSGAGGSMPAGWLWAAVALAIAGSGAGYAAWRRRGRSA